MDLGLSFEEANGYLLVRVTGEWTRERIKQGISNIAEEAQTRRYSRLLVDARQLSAPKREFDRFLAGVQAATELASLDVAVVYRPDWITKFAENAAVNRGASVIVVSEIDEAVNWLMRR